MSAYLPWLTDMLTAYVGGTVKLALLGKDSIGNLYVQDVVTHQYWSDVSAYEIVGTGYTAGGVAVTGLTITQDDTFTRSFVDFDDLDFGNIAPTPNSICAAVLYIDTGTPTTSILIAADVFTETTGGFSWTYSPTPEGFVVLAAV